MLKEGDSNTAVVGLVAIGYKKAWISTANPKGDRTTGIWLEISRWVSV
jgi:hypothetical protein